MSLHIFERKRDSRGFPDISVATATKRRRHKARRRKRRAFSFEPLEQRRVLSTLLVNTIDDVVDSGDAYLSLREAISVANASSQNDTINLSAGSYDLTLAGPLEDGNATGDLDITKATGTLTIIGHGADMTTIDASGLSDRVFHVLGGVTLELSGVTITGGSLGSENGGGIFNAGVLSLVDSVITGNYAIAGGGIYNDSGAELLISGSAVSNNLGEEGPGGGIYNLGTAVIATTTISANWGDTGGGIANAGTLTVQDNSEISGNEAYDAGLGGGGIYNELDGVVSLTSCTISDNVAPHGGGIRLEPGSSLAMNLCTLDSNTAGGSEVGFGGAIWASGEEADTSIEIVDSDISNNSALIGGGIYGSYLESENALTITGTNLAENDAIVDGGGIYLEYSNLSLTDSTFTLNTAMNFGGGLYVYEAVDAVTIADSTFTGNEADGDGGAIHVLNSEPALTVTGTSFVGNIASLSGGIYVERGNLSLDDSIFSENEGGAFSVYEASDVVLINNSIFTENEDIDGVVLVQQSEVEISGSTFTDNQTRAIWAVFSDMLISGSELSRNSSDEGGTIYALGGNLEIVNTTLADNHGDYGGAIYHENGEAMDIENCHLIGNTATDVGGAIYSASDSAIVTITGITVADNVAGFGGGIYFAEGESLDIANSTFANNSAIGEDSGGGALEVASSTVFIDGSTFTGNISEGNGGAIRIDGDEMTISNSTFSGNTSEGEGGAIRVDGIEMTISNSTFSGNSAVEQSGAIHNHSETVTIINSTITDNWSPVGGGGGITSMGHLGAVTILKNTIVAGNASPVSAPPDVYAPGESEGFVSDGHNLIGDGTGSGAFDHGSNGDLVGTSGSPIAPELGPLQDNGGPTLTHALLSTSLALDAGDASGAPATDQRGVSRPQAEGIDIGAFELDDSDADGISGEVEDSHPNGGDGNYDGTPDSEQVNVTSLLNAIDGQFITLASPAGTSLVNVRALDLSSLPEPPVGVEFPVGLFEYEVHGIAPGGDTTVTMFLPTDVTVNTFYKYGPEPLDTADHWYEFLLDGGVTGAEFVDVHVDGIDEVVLYFTDGARGDDDLSENGIIVEPGGTGFGEDVNQLPTADASGPYNVPELGSVTLSGSGSNDPDGSIVLYEWDLDYDGVTFDVDATGESSEFSAAWLAGPATRTVGLRVTDDDAAFSLIDTATVTITDAYLADYRFYVDQDAIGGTNNGTSWTDAFTDLQSALLVADPGDEIWVAEGVYKPTSGTDRTNSFNLETGVDIYGGFAGMETSLEQRDWTTYMSTLSGDIGTPGDASDNSYHVVYAYEVTGSTLDGFIVTAGNADGPTPHYNGGGIYSYRSSPTFSHLTVIENSADHDGGGMLNYHSYVDEPSVTLIDVSFVDNTAGQKGGGMRSRRGLPTLTDVRFIGNSSSENGGGMHQDLGSGTLTDVSFSGNTAANWGGGMYNYNPYPHGSPTLTNVTFSGNSAGNAGGGMYNNSSSPTLTNVIFSHNSTGGNGGGLYNGYSSSPTLTDVVFSENTADGRGGGMLNWGQSSPTITNIIFSGNVSGYRGGGMYNYESSPQITNALFHRNTSDFYGGAIDNHASQLSLTNVTFSENSAAISGGAMYSNHSVPTLTNSILWGNAAPTDPQISNGVGSSTAVSFSIVQGGWGGAGNLDAAPLFADAANGDLHLLPGSPAIDAGTASGAPLFDLDKNPRPYEGDGDATPEFDMGAYEAQNQPPLADANGPYTGEEGSPVVFDASGSIDPNLDPLQYRWDFNNDGTWDTNWLTSPTVEHSWTDDYSGTVAVEVWDGQETDTATSTVTVNNVTPQFVTVGVTPEEIDENGLVELSGVFTDGEPITDGLVAWWRAEGDAADTYDARDGILHGDSQFDTGISGQAFDFDGSGDYVASPYTIPDGENPETTISAWVKPNSLGDRTVVKIRDHRSLGVSQNYVFFAGTQTQLSSQAVYAVAIGSIPTDDWTHLVGTWDGQNSRIYVDGVLRGKLRGFD